MSAINEESQWGNEIPLIARTDKVAGGKTGLVNVQATILANRTQYLKGQLEAYNTLIKSGELPFTSLPDAQAAISAGKIPEGAIFSVRSEDARVWAEEFRNADGVAVSTGKKILDGQSFTVTIFPTDEDPDGTITGISATFTGQTFRVVFSGETDGREVLYRNDNGTAIPLSETVSKAAVDAVSESVANLLPLNNTSRFIEVGAAGSELARVTDEDIKLDKDNFILECIRDGMRMFFVPVWSEKITTDELEINGTTIDPAAIPPAIMAENLLGLARSSKFLDPDAFKPGGELASIKDEDIKLDKDKYILECIRDGKRVFFIPVEADELTTRSLTHEGASKLLDPAIFSKGGEMESWSGYDNITCDKEGNVLSYVKNGTHYILNHHSFSEINVDRLYVGGVDAAQLFGKSPTLKIPYTEEVEGKSQIFALDTVTGKQTQLTDGTANETLPDVGPDGLLTWHSDREDNVPGGRYFLDKSDIIRPLISRNILVGWGDSFMEQPVMMNKLHELTGLTTYNFGKSGLRSTAVAARQGGAPFYCMPDGGVIPASGSVNLLPNLPGPAASASNGAMTGIKCNLGGVDGTFNWSGTQAYFTRDVAGEAASVPALLPLFVYPYTTSSVVGSVAAGTRYDLHDEAILLLTCGRNNTTLWWEPINDLKSIVGYLKPRGIRFAYMPQFTQASEIRGTDGYQRIHRINQEARDLYPENYVQIDDVDLLQNFKNHYNPASAQDVADIENDTTPTSLRTDALHPSQVLKSDALYIGAEVNAEFNYLFFKSKGWVK
ncbi:TPA: hypothetical protein M2P04_000300 [Klebsiella variicola]|uniref:hypothetical protein n=1 Tax=Klebsiella variicola TaxID=244366 RepID=UPI0015A75935|nr:hypothetical protein [Klebsiella variicola]HDL0121226.1 hypothetical protein [Klebsiella variicola]